ncbi:MAG: 3-carboxy-cis,cis-muconate cycloisomerase [Azospirillaceae bacterium]
MTAGPYPAYLDGLLGDAAVAAALSAEARLKAMIRVEAALAAAQADLGLIPEAAADAIAGLADAPPPDPAVLADAALADGVVVPGLVAALRRALPQEHAAWLHHGATSQDIEDTALCLCLRDVLAILAGRLDGVMDRLAGLAESHRATLAVAHTRGQAATPTTFGLIAAGWLAPLVRQAGRLPAIEGDALALSLGGAAGTRAALGPSVAAIEAGMAERLGLPVPMMPWHAQRDGVAALGGWLATLAGLLGKMAGDVALMARSEAGGLRLAGAGGSSTMPNKRNPVRAEAILALARRAPGDLATLHGALVHAEQRDGAAWQAEWAALPALAEAAGAALAHATCLLDTLEVDAAALRAPLERDGGLVLAEAAVFALAGHMPRPAAQSAVNAACGEALETGAPLADVLARSVDAPVDWTAFADPARHTGDGDALIDRVVSARAALSTNGSETGR